MPTVAFIAVMILIIAALWIILYKLNQNYCRSHYYRNHCLFENRIEHKENVPCCLDFVNTGSGYGRFAFDYSRYSGVGYNFAQSPQCLEMDFGLLQQFSDKLSKGCVVCITLPVFIFGFKRYPQMKYNAKYYGCLEPRYIHNYSRISKAICTKYPLLIAGKNGIHAIWDKVVPCEETYDNCVIPKANRKRYLENHVNVWLRQFRLKNLKDPSVFHLQEAMDYNVALLSKMIDYCIDKEWNPVLVTTPLCKTLNDMFSQEFLDAILYDNIAAANKKGIPYFDYRKCDAYQNDEDMFWNGIDWLSARGRNLFMEMITNQLLSKEGAYGWHGQKNI